jgi:hypothetical protein
MARPEAGKGPRNRLSAEDRKKYEESKLWDNIGPNKKVNKEKSVKK